MSRNRLVRRPFGLGTRIQLPLSILPSLLLVGILFSMGVAAANDEDAGYSTPGVFLGFSGSVAALTSLEDDARAISVSQPIGGVDVDPGIGLHARAGYRFHPRVAADFHFEWVPEIDVSNDRTRRPTGGRTADNPSTIAEVEVKTFTLDTRAYLWTGRIQPYALVGVGLMDVNVNNESALMGGRVPTVVMDFEDDEGMEFAARFGGGLEFYFSERFALALDATYVLPTGDIDGYDYVSVQWGFLYRFGGTADR
jgi:opacity protein-like surface antigen